jgi:hypothetical protein
VDMVSCNLPAASQCVNILQEYQKFVQRRFREGARVPLKLSEYLELHAGGRRFKPISRERAAGANA